MGKNDSETRTKIWVQHVNVDADMLEMRVLAAEARGLDVSQRAIARGVQKHIASARNAANCLDPRPRRFANWWEGTLTEAAYRNLHAARVQMVDLLDDDEIPAEVHSALSRAELTLPRDDPRRIPPRRLTGNPAQVRPFLRRLMDDSYTVLDSKHAQLRSFRNILLLTALIVALLVAFTVVLVALRPTWVPLCFPGAGGAGSAVICPTSGDGTGSRSGDVLVVALLGALGGALTAAISIRNLKGTSTPYDVPVALAMLKVPLGAFTAILALVAIQGEFVPGLSALDSQQQILAYALVFGFSQQLLTRLLDQRAQTLLEDLPGGEGTEPHVPPVLDERKPPQPVQDEEPPSRNGRAPSTVVPAELPEDDLNVLSSDEPIVEPVEDEEFPAIGAEDEVLEPDPLTGQGGEFQDQPVEDFSAEDLAAELPVEDIDVVTSGEPVLEPPAEDEEFPTVVTDAEFDEVDPLTDQGYDLQDDEADAEQIVPAVTFSVFENDQRG